MNILLTYKLINMIPLNDYEAACKNLTPLSVNVLSLLSENSIKEVETVAKQWASLREFKVIDTVHTQTRYQEIYKITFVPQIKTHLRKDTGLM